MKRKKFTCRESNRVVNVIVLHRAVYQLLGAVTHKYGDQNRCFDDPPWIVIDYLPASVRRDKKVRLHHFSMLNFSTKAESSKRLRRRVDVLRLFSQTVKQISCNILILYELLHSLYYTLLFDNL